MSRRLIALFFTLVTVAPILAADKVPPSPLLKSESVAWTGIDYSMVRMIGPGEFNQPEAIFPGMLDAWNSLFLQERLRFVAKRTKKKVIIDVSGMTEVNKTATSKQIINSPRPDDIIEKSHISSHDIANAVRSYKLEETNGLGAVFIVDRLVKMDKKGQGAVYVVFFDIVSRDVLFTQRQVSKAVGFGFRNYWFRVIKDAEPALSKYR